MFKFLTNSATLVRIDALEKRVLARLDELERRASLLEKQVAVATKTPKLTRGPVTTAPLTPSHKPVLEEPRVSTPIPPWSAPTPTRKPSKARTPHVAFIIGHTDKSKGAYSKTLMLSEYDYWNKAFPTKHTTETYYVAGEAIPHFTYSVHRRDVHGVSGAYREASRTNPLITVELHFNSHVNATAEGIEVLAVSHRGFIVAEKMAEKFSEMTGQLLRQNGTGVLNVSGGGRGSASLFQLVKPVSVLIEPFFGSNPTEAKLWDDPLVAHTRVMRATASAVSALIDDELS